MERELNRIDYRAMYRKGSVRMVRRRNGGGYYTILTPPEGASETKRVAFRSRFVHIAVGYPGLRFLPDLQEYRTKYNDYSRVVNAYEPHEHVYEDLKRKPGIVVVRGGGIVASRVLQRLIDDRNLHGAQTTIVHLLRTYVAGQARAEPDQAAQGRLRHRPAGVQLAEERLGRRLQAAAREGDARAAQGAAQLAGRHHHAAPQAVAPAARERQEGRLLPPADRQGRGGDARRPDGRINTRILTSDRGPVDVAADYVIDGTGLEADITENRVIKDLFEKTGAVRSPYGKLDVELSLRGQGHAEHRRHDLRVGFGDARRPVRDGRLVPRPAVPGVSASADELAKLGFCKKIGVGRSISQWIKWCRNTPLP